MEPPQFTPSQLFAPFLPPGQNIPPPPPPAPQVKKNPAPVTVGAEGLDISFSSDSEQGDKEHKETKAKTEVKPEEAKTKDQVMGEPGKEDDDDPSSSSKFRTAHEEEPDEFYDESTVPKVQELAATDVLVIIGTVDGVLEDKCIVKADLSIGTVDLDNVIYTDKRQCVGFIEDVFGPVNQPLYCVHNYPKAESKDVPTIVKGTILYTPLRTLRLVVLAAVETKKGCDASNIYDEEVGEGEMEYSDDEKEQSAKKARKMATKKKRAHPLPAEQEAVSAPRGPPPSAAPGRPMHRQQRPPFRRPYVPAPPPPMSAGGMSGAYYGNPMPMAYPMMGMPPGYAYPQAPSMDMAMSAGMIPQYPPPPPPLPPMQGYPMVQQQSPYGMPPPQMQPTYMLPPQPQMQQQQQPSQAGVFQLPRPLR